MIEQRLTCALASLSSSLEMGGLGEGTCGGLEFCISHLLTLIRTTCSLIGFQMP